MSKFIAFVVISFITYLVCSGDGKESGRFEERITGGIINTLNKNLAAVCLLGPQTLCMASGLSNRYYLTAAHCVPLPGTLGEYLMLASRWWCWGRNSYESIKICPRSILVTRHPRYIPGRVGGHDLAVIKANKVMMSNFWEVGLAPLPFKDDFKDCFVFGKGAIIWDATKTTWLVGYPYDKVTFNRTMYHHTPFFGSPVRYDHGLNRPHHGFSHLNMTARHGTCGHYPTHLQRRIICGNRVQGPKGEPVGVCYGDGGAPLICNVEGNYYTFGVLSMIAPARAGLDRLPFYNTCGHVDYIDTFTYLCPYYGWIKSFSSQIRLQIPPEGCGGLRPSANFAVLAAFFTLISKSPIST